MNLLKDGIMQQAVIKTAQTRKLTVDGLTKAYPVYKVRLDWLFYNDQNDRIATWISQYKAQHDGKAPNSSDREAYNAIIEQFIVESNPEAIRKTQTNIEMVDQREAGVVLADGRIIDGNRRFTCLRRLAAKNDRFSYFETVILDRNIEHSAKQISVCHDAIYFEYSYNLVHLLQSKDRIHRLGLPDDQYTQYYYQQLFYQTEDGSWSLGEAVYNRLKEKEKIMLDAIDNHVLEAMPTNDEDLEMIFSKFH